MAGFYDSASNDFNTAINNYKNNMGSVAQSMIQGDIGQVSNAKDLLMEKAGILAGGEESSISDKIQAGMSKTMDELGLDMSVHTIGSKVLPWVAKKLKGKFKNMREEREQARRENSQQTRDDIPESEDAGRQEILDNMSNRADLNNDTTSLPRGGGQNAGAGTADRTIAQPNTGGGTSGSAADASTGDLDGITGGARASRTTNPDQSLDDDDARAVRNPDGTIQEDEETRIARKSAQDNVDDISAGTNKFGGVGEVGSGNAAEMAAQKAAQQSSNRFVRGDARGEGVTTIDNAPVARAAAADSGGAARAAGGGDSAWRSGVNIKSKPETLQEGLSRKAADGSKLTPEQEETLRGKFDPDATPKLIGDARGGRTGPPKRPDSEVDDIQARPPPATARSATTTSKTSEQYGGDASLESSRATSISGRGVRVPKASDSPARAGPNSNDPFGRGNPDLEDSMRGTPDIVQPTRTGGQTPRSAQDEDISAPRAPVRDPYSSSSRPTDIASEEQMTSSGALRDLQAQAATEARSTTSTIGDYEATFTEKAAGAAGDFVGFLGDVLGPAAAIFGGVEAARGIHADIKDSLDPNNDPFAQVSKLIGKAQGQQAGMNAAISADQFSSKVGAGRPSFGSLAAPTFDSSSIMQGMGGHF